MGLANYKITFKAEIESGYELEKVKQDVASLFKLDQQQLNNFFSGSKVTLKKNITKEQAQEYYGILKSLGLIVYLEETAIMMVDVFDHEVADSQSTTAEVTRSQAYQKIVRHSKPTKQHANKAIQSPAIFNFDCTARYGRLNYLNAELIILLLLLPSLLLWFIPVIGSFASIIFLVLFIIFALRITILRLHDLGLPAWFSLLVFVPIVNCILYLVLLFSPGSDRANKYGPPVKPGSIISVIVILATIPLLLVFAPMVVPIYQDYIYRTRVEAVYNHLSRFSYDVDRALTAGKIPILGSETSEPNIYMPMKMADGDVIVAISNNPTIKDVMMIGLDLPSNDENARVYAIFNHQLLNITAVTISLEKQPNGVWSCVFTGDSNSFGRWEASWQDKYIPKSCKISNNRLF